jgi:hypothetical protein
VRLLRAQHARRIVGRIAIAAVAIAITFTIAVAGLRAFVNFGSDVVGATSEPEPKREQGSDRKRDRKRDGESAT